MTFLKKAVMASTVLFLASFIVNAEPANHPTRRLQVLINTQDPSFKFVINDGNGLHYGNPFFPRPFGSLYYLNGLIFPEGTINVNQPNYTVDTHGQPLNRANSIGDWWCIGNVLTDLLNLPQVPATPTDAEAIVWDFLFKHTEKNRNNIYTSGIATTGVFAPNQPLFTVLNSVVGGTGKNNGLEGNLSAKVYFQAATGALLINVTFTENICY